MTTNEEYKNKIDAIREKIWYMNPQTDVEELEYASLCKKHEEIATAWNEYRKAAGLSDMIAEKWW